jgi:glycosyltransferase involved in cell wall biosynthesis
MSLIPATKILFISHDASRTGAPIILLNLLEWLKYNSEYDISVYLRQHGDIENDFARITATYFPKKENTLRFIFNKTVSKVFQSFHINKIPKKLLRQSFDLIYLNTVVSLDLAPYLKKVFKCPIVCHVHENEYTIKNHFSQYMSGENLANVDHFIAASKSTLDNLVTHHAINPQKISLIYEFITMRKIKEQSVPPELIRKELGLSDEFVVGGSGLTTWRKGIDLFVQLVTVLNKLRPDCRIKFVWVGYVYREFSCQFDYEAKRLGITDKIIFTGIKSNPLDYFNLFDLFALTSREDPFPLVAIEAGSLHKPIICFNNSGGMAELIENGKNGVIVPYNDVDEMAKKILQLMDNERLRIEMGKAAGVMMKDFDVNIAGKQIVKVIDKLIAN